MKCETNLYIDILKYGRDNLNNEFISENKLFKHLEELGYNFSPYYKQTLWTNLCRSVFKNDNNSSQNQSYLLTPDAYFQLLEHERLEDARQSSKKSLTIAKWAIAISIIISIISIFTSIFTNKNNTVIVNPNNKIDNISLIYNTKDSTYEVYNTNDDLLLEFNYNNTDSLSMETLGYINKVLKEKN